MSCQLLASRVASGASATTCLRPSANTARPTPRLPAHGSTPRQPLQVACQAGFGPTNTNPASSSKSKSKPKAKPLRLAKELGREVPTPQSTKSDEAEDKGNWFSVDATLADFDKPIKPVILKTGRAIVLYKVGDEVFCSDANSTAYQYPLVDAKVLDLPSGPAVEVPLDGTQYDLRTGKVLKWCPTDSPMRAVLGTLKKAAKATDLPVHRTRVNEDGRIFVTLV